MANRRRHDELRAREAQAREDARTRAPVYPEIDSNDGVEEQSPDEDQVAFERYRAMNSKDLCTELMLKMDQQGNEIINMQKQVSMCI